MGWNELINRLLVIQKAQGFPGEWVLEQIELAGHPPKPIWRAIAQALGYTKFWADWRHLPGHETEEPESGAIDWEKYQIPGKPPPPTMPVLKR